MKDREILYWRARLYLRRKIHAWLNWAGLGDWMLEGPPWLRRLRWKLLGFREVAFIPIPKEVTIVVSQIFVRDSKGWVVVRQYRTVSTTKALEIMERIQSEVVAGTGIPHRIWERMVEDPPRIPKMIR